MSLQVWLPLTKDLRQQGLSDVSVTNNGATYSSTGGKLGGCYSFGTGASSLSLPTSTFTSLDGEFSVTCWVKIISWNTSYATMWAATSTSASYANIMAGMFRNGTTSKILFCIGNNSTSTQTNCMTTADISLNTWNHFVCTYTAGKICLYQNGELVSTYNTSIVPAFSTTQYVNIGKMRESTYQSNCTINDFRIYDHCLSAVEVKRISQGLILHYPLNRNGWGQENLIWNSNWNLHSTTPPENWVNWGSPPTREIVTINGKNWLHVISNTTQFQGYSQNWTKRNGVGELSAGQKVTISFTAYLAAAATVAPIGIHWNNSSGTIVSQNWTTVALTTSPKRYHFTYTTPSDCVAFNIMVGDNTNTAHEVWITDIKLELGEVATPWCPNSADALYTTLGLNDNVEYDISGFNNNGTKTGTFTYTSDTPKYSVSTQFGSTSTKIQLPAMSFTGMADSYTFAWWQYNVGTGNMPWGFSNGNRLNCYHTSPLCWNTGDGSTNQFKDGSTTTSPFALQNGWHHMVVTGDGTSAKLYIDGVYRGTAITYKPLTGTQIWISGWDSSTSYTFNGSKECDFRIYATALSASDVLSLYQNCATIDSDGTIHGQIR